MRKILFTLMLLVAATATMMAYDFEVDGIYYKLESDGVNINDGNEVSVTYKTTSYNSYTGDVIIPAEVTYNGTTYYVNEIGVSAFRDCKGLTSVTIPNSVINIFSHAFHGCSGLTCIDIPNSVIMIADNAFYGCTGLTSVFIPTSVMYIGGSFTGCTGITNFTVSLDNEHYDSRDNCNAIIDTYHNALVEGCKNSVIPNSVTAIGADAFNSCSSLMSIDIPNSVTTIGDCAFFECTGLDSIIIPNSVTHIGMGAFYGCIGLASINIPNSVTNIDQGAFYGCSGVTSISIGSSITSIDFPDWGIDCSVLTNITVDSGNSYFDSRNGSNAVIETSSNTLLYGCKNTIIPNSVTTIADYAFSGCSGLTSIDIPNSVTSIGNNAFYNCRGLTSIVCLATTPPSTGDQVFYTWSTPNIYENATLFVPAESLEAYQSHEEWGIFTHIVPFLGAGPGDINGDGNIAISDVTNLIDTLLSGDELPAYADVNGDGNVGIKDVTDLIDMLLNGN